ncbi:hypothetical protein J3F83DRAFT_544913 [Trichoderma novae-zelandiae]
MSCLAGAFGLCLDNLTLAVEFIAVGWEGVSFLLRPGSKMIRVIRGKVLPTVWFTNQNGLHRRRNLIKQTKLSLWSTVLCILSIAHHCLCSYMSMIPMLVQHTRLSPIVTSVTIMLLGPTQTWPTRPSRRSKPGYDARSASEPASPRQRSPSSAAPIFPTSFLAFLSS